MGEFFRRLKIGIAIGVGFLSGKLAAGFFDQHSSEFFSAGFILGVLLIQGIFWLYDQWRRHSVD